MQNKLKRRSILPVLACMLLLISLCACGLSETTLPSGEKTAAGVPTAPEADVMPSPAATESGPDTALPEEDKTASDPVSDPASEEPGSSIKVEKHIMEEHAAVPELLPESVSDTALDPEERVDRADSLQAAPQAEAEPDPATVLPTVTKSPTDETVEEGGSCLFLAGYENAVLAVWHFVSPDGQTDMTYEAAQTAFPSMEIRNGMYSNLRLSNVPYSLNGWRVYCQYSNPGVGYVNTETARITVIASQEQQNLQNQGSATAYAVSTDFAGGWAKELDMERCQIVMTWAGNGNYQVFIAWATGQMERSVWSMTATPAGTGRLEYRGGEYWVESYASDGSYTVSGQRSGEAGSFSISAEGKLIWDDTVMGETVLIKVA